MNRMMRVIFFLVLLMQDSFLYGQNSAGCLLRFEDHILVVRDIWSGRFSFPAGGRDPNESPEINAERETYEETGLIAKADRELARFDNFALFHCKIEEPIKVYQTGHDTLNLLVPRHVRNEIYQIMLVNIEDISAKTWRFPSQVDEVKDIFLSSDNSGVYEMTDEQIKTSSWQEWQLIFIRNLQGFSFLKSIMKLSNSLGSFHVFLVVLSFLMIGVTRSFGFKFASILFFSGAVNVVLKEYWQTMRPIDFMPSLEMITSYGYSFPSGHAQVSATFFTLLALRFRRIWPLCLLVTFLIGMARVYFGAHFPHDVLGGWLIGMVIALLFYKYSNVYLLFAACVGLLFIHMSPGSVAMVSLFFGILLGAWEKEKTRWAAWNVLLSAIPVALGIFLWPYLVNIMFSSDRTYLVSLQRTIATNVLIGGWISLASVMIPRALNKLWPVTAMGKD